MLRSGWSPFFLVFPTPRFFFTSLWRHFHVHQLQLVSPSHSYSKAFFFFVLRLDLSICLPFSLSFIFTLLSAGTANPRDYKFLFFFSFFFFSLILLSSLLVFLTEWTLTKVHEEMLRIILTFRILIFTNLKASFFYYFFNIFCKNVYFFHIQDVLWSLKGKKVDIEYRSSK